MRKKKVKRTRRLIDNKKIFSASMETKVNLLIAVHLTRGTDVEVAEDCQLYEELKEYTYEEEY